MTKKINSDKADVKHSFVWVRNDNAPFDIWIQESEIEPTKAIIAMYDFFGDRNATKEQRDIEQKKYIEERKDKIPFERVLSFYAAMFGNKPERTITILRGKDVVERWERKQNCA